MLKGCQGDHQADDDSQMMWILMAMTGVILLWEGVKAATRPCQRALGMSQHSESSSSSVQVNVSVGSQAQSSETDVADVGRGLDGLGTTATSSRLTPPGLGSERDANFRGGCG